MEPYNYAFYNGSERISTRFESQPIMEKCTYEDRKALLEQPYPGKDEVFAKDMAFYVMSREDYATLLPKDYIHTFIIRNPRKSIRSFYKISVSTVVPGWDRFEAREAGFKNIYNLYDFVTTQLGQEAIIVDADDLVTYPEDVLRLYCSKVGIDFQESMVKWEHPPGNMKPFEDWIPWLKDLLESTGFQPPESNKSPEEIELPELVQKTMHESIPYYEKMYALRLKPNKQ